MFFIGIFGINNGQKPLDTCNNLICPSCGALTRLEVYKTYNYFHIFFIPTFRWSIKYRGRTACCGSEFLLDQETGSMLEKGLSPVITERNLTPDSYYSPYRLCPDCRNHVDSRYNFCPVCGRKL